MKRVLNILAISAMAFGFFGSNLAHSQGCKCECQNKGTPQQTCTCDCHQPPVCDKQGCHINKEEFAKVLAQKQTELATQLELSKAQQDQAKIIFDAKFKALDPVMEELRAKKIALRDIERSSFEIGQIRAKRHQREVLQDEVSALKKQRKEIFEKHMCEFEAILTEPQKAKWQEMKQERKAWHKKHKGHGHRHNGGCCFK